MRDGVVYGQLGRMAQARELSRPAKGSRRARFARQAQRRGMVCARRAVELEAEITALAGSLRTQKARLLALVGEYDALDGWVSSGAISCAHWLATLLDVELCTAREHVRVARALRDLPETAARVATGELSYAKAREVTRIATAATETEVLALAAATSAGTLARTLTNWQLHRAPAGLAARQRAARSCTYHVEADGTITMRLRLTPDAMAAIRAVVDRAAHDGLRTARPVDAGPRTLVQTRADAAAELLAAGSGMAGTSNEGVAKTEVGAPDSGDAPAGASLRAARPAPVEVVLHRRIDRAEIDGVVLAPETAARLSCDAAIRVMLHRPDGSPADLGRRQRLVSPRLRRLVLERDEHCRHPGCTATDFLELHHVVAWEDGGPTDLANLEARCEHHHAYVHEHHPGGAERPDDLAS